MAHATTASRLIRRLRMRPAPYVPDFADFGTAFGLELSMQPEAPPVAPVTDRARDPGWWRRLAARRAAPGT